MRQGQGHWNWFLPRICQILIFIQHAMLPLRGAADLMGFAPAASPPLCVTSDWWLETGVSGLGGSWGYLGGSKLGGLGAILAPSLGVLGPSWLQVGGSWGHFGAKLGHLGANLGHLRAQMGHLGASWSQNRASWKPLEASWRALGNLCKFLHESA